jgi:formamidopyrimidine-DNA glycosylase
VKAALMNQAVLAGIGNLYADEILFQAGVHPRAAPRRLSRATLRRLYRTMERVLRAAIAARAEPANLPRTFLLRHRGDDGRCPRCGRRLRTMRVSGRTTYYCPRRQGR